MARIEPIQLVRYKPGEKFSAHHDYHEDDARDVTSHEGEQRAATLLVFLSTTPRGDGDGGPGGDGGGGGAGADEGEGGGPDDAQFGGELSFPLLAGGEVRIVPTRGDAVLFLNIQGDGVTVNPQSLHEGRAPVRSHKYAANIWIADREFS